MNVYDLLRYGHATADLAVWVAGAGDVDGLPRLDRLERVALRDSWEFWARPGQRWTPGAEDVTLCSGGRGVGKTLRGSHAVHEAALDPERWGCVAMVVGPEPGHVRRDCIEKPKVGLLALPHICPSRYLTPTYHPSRHLLQFPPAPGKGGASLEVRYASSADAKSTRGPDVGLLWGDEVGFWYWDTLDANGNNVWEASRAANRAPPAAKAIATTTPTERPELVAMWDEAHRPTCPKCQERLPEIPRRRVSPDFSATTTEPVRRCPTCAGEVIAEHRAVVESTLDNRAYLDAASIRRAARELAGGASSAKREYGGDLSARSGGALVRDQDVRRLPLDLGEGADARCDWEMQALRLLGVSEVLVFVDPATTSGEGSADTGVVVVGLRWAEVPRVLVTLADGTAVLHESETTSVLQVVGLEDLSVTPEEVEGAPSSVWAPRAAEAAERWGAARIVVEANQGGDEVVDAARQAITRAAAAAPDEAQAAAVLLAARGGSRPVAILEARRRASVDIRVEAVTRRADKRVRWGWLGDRARVGQVALVECPHLTPATGWGRIRGQLGWTPDARKPRDPPKKDAADALVGGAQVLLKVRETRGRIEDAPADWTLVNPDGR